MQLNSSVILQRWTIPHHRLAREDPFPAIAEAAPAGLSRTGSLTVGYFASLLVHAAVLAAPFISMSRSDFGAISRPSQAISTEHTFSLVLDAVTVTPQNQPAPASAASAAGTQSDRKPIEMLEPVQNQPREIKEVDAVHETNEKQASAPPMQDVPLADPPEGLKVIGGAAQSPIATFDVEAPQKQPIDPSARESQVSLHDLSKSKPRATSVHDTKAHEDKRQPEREDGKRRAEKEAARPKGSLTSKSSNGAGKSGGHVSASRGDILSYAAIVRSRVASRRSSGYGAQGRVIVSFSVTPGGGLGSARIASSSGNGALDSAALGAVRGAAPFPPPPSGAGAMRFSVPFYYR